MKEEREKDLLELARGIRDAATKYNKKCKCVILSFSADSQDLDIAFADKKYSDWETVGKVGT